MARATTGTRLERLERLESLLKSGEMITAGAMATELGVAPRSLWRDIAILRDKGLPIEADRGRGGGIRLPSNWGAGRLTLDHQEAIDLLISLAIAEQMKSPLFMANLKSIRRKLTASFAAPLKRRLDDLKARVLVGPSASPFVLSGFATAPPPAVAELHRAFVMLQRLRIVYRDERAKVSTRTIEPHYLLLNYPVWYALAWDELRDGVRTFRCDRIGKAEALDAPFRLRPRAEFGEALAGAAAV